MDEPNCLEDANQEAVDLETELNSDGSWSTTMEKNENSIPPSEYAYLYKGNPLSNCQDKRRKQLLKIQKMNRNKTYDENRDILEFLVSDEEMASGSNCMPTTRNYRNKYKYTKARPMFSEWLTEVPSDLESEWFIKLCPIGVRNIIIANNFRTRAYKNGKLVAEFESNLPAGRSNLSEKDSLTILDGVYNHVLKCIFILDILVWKGCNLCKSPASLRFFWLKSRLSEVAVQEITDVNEYRLIEVPEFPAELAVIEEKLAQPFRELDRIVPLDGILFYHKETWYMSGVRTPLVGWLKPYMIPEKLHIPVSEYFIHKKPKNYVSLEQYLLNHAKPKTDIVMKEDNAEEPMG